MIHLTHIEVIPQNVLSLARDMVIGVGSDLKVIFIHDFCS